MTSHLSHYNTLIQELNALADPILAAIEEIEQAKASAETEQAISETSLKTEKVLTQMFTDARQAVARLSQSPQVVNLPQRLSTLYMNASAAVSHIKLCCDNLRAENARTAQEQAKVAAAKQAELDRIAAYDRETEALRRRILGV